MPKKFEHVHSNLRGNISHIALVISTTNVTFLYELILLMIFCKIFIKIVSVPCPTVVYVKNGSKLVFTEELNFVQKCFKKIEKIFLTISKTLQPLYWIKMCRIQFKCLILDGTFL